MSRSREKNGRDGYRKGQMGSKGFVSSAPEALVTSVGWRMLEKPSPYIRQKWPLSKSFSGESLLAEEYTTIFEYGGFATPVAIQMTYPVFTSNCATAAGNNAIITDIQNWWDNLYPVLQQMIAATGKFLTFFSTLTSGDVNAYVDAYSKIFLRLRMFEAILASSGKNTVLNKLAQNVENNRTQLEGLLARLATFTIPVGWRDVLDNLCGVFLPDEDGVPLIVGYDAGSTTVTGQVDFTVAANVTSFLATISTDLDTLSTAIKNVQVATLFATAYGAMEPLGPKDVQVDRCLYSMHVNQCAQYRNSTTSLTVSLPNLVASSNIPILVPSGETCPQLLSLLRPLVYSKQDSNATPAGAGLLSFSNNEGLAAVYYDNSLASHKVGMNGAGFNPSNFYGSIFDRLTFAAPLWIAGDATYVNWAETFDNYELYAAQEDYLVRETQYALSKIFWENQRPALLKMAEPAQG